MITDLRAADWSTPAVVLKFDQNMLHHGSLGVIRSLGRLGVPVYGVHEGAWAPAASSRYLAGRFFWQPDPDDPQRTLSGLLDLASRIGRRAVLYVTDDAGAIFLAEHGDALREAFAFPRPPADLPRRLAGKYSMFQLCRDLGVPTPQATMAWSPGEAAAFAAQAGFPLIAKLTTPWRGAGTGAGQPLRSTTIVATLAELRDVCARADQASAGLMLQEYIPPAPGQDWFFHGYVDEADRCAPAFTGVKDRSYPAYAGLTSLGRAVPNGRLAGQVTAMAAAIGFRGIADLDLRFDPRDAEYKLLDFNPRLGAQFRLFTTGTGVDVARAAYLDLTGQPVAAGEMIRGRRFLVENYDPLGAVGYWRRGELGPRSWAASLRGVDEFAWLARDDLRPFGLMCARMAWRAVSRRMTRSHTRGPSALLRATGGPRYRPGPRGTRDTCETTVPHEAQFSTEGERV
jgi:predicted ATP-grasp superfamily ATP-dependent carboligase